MLHLVGFFTVGHTERLIGKWGPFVLLLNFCFGNYSTIKPQILGAFDRKVATINIVLDPILEMLPKQMTKNNKPAYKA
jgi:hypothetical protein